MSAEARKDPIEVIEGSFDPTVGPVHFRGKLIIKGDVPEKSEISSNSSVEVHGIVDTATIRAHGDIIIKGGVSGPGYLDAGRDIQVEFVENSTLVSGRNLVIGMSAIHSQLSAGNKIIVKDEKGVLAGGVAKAGQAIRAARIGSSLYTRMKLQVGIQPLLRSEHKRIVDQMTQIEQKHDGIQKNIQYLKRLAPDDISPRMAKRIENLPLMQLHLKHLSRELMKYTDRDKTLRKAINTRSKPGRIDAIKEICPGIMITINWTTLELKEHLENVTFFEQGGEIGWDALQPEDINKDELDEERSGEKLEVEEF